MRKAKRHHSLSLVQYASLIGDQVRQMLVMMDHGMVTPVYFVDGKVLTRQAADV